MKLVVDTNIIISALLKDGVTRRIIFSPFILLITPEHSLKEISKYEKLICKKAKLKHDEFRIVLNIIFEKILIVPKEEYIDKIRIAKTMIKDADDVPFIALYLSSRADGIWSDDNDFKTRKDLLIFRTKELALIFKSK
jgi:putative PIN family toxin of toxin-antitoxin system